MNTGSVDQLIASGLSHLKSRRRAEAERYFRQALDINPSHADALHLLGVLTAEQGDRAAGIRLIQKAVAVLPTYSAAFANLGRLLADDGQLVASIAAYKQVTVLSPKNCSGWYNHAVACRMNGQLTDAIASLQICLRLEPANADAITELGNAFMKLGKSADAVVQFENALRFAPHDPDAYNNLGSALIETGKNLEAIPLYERAIEINSRNPIFYTNLGGALTRVYRLDEALRMFEVAMRLDPGYLPAYNGCAKALAKLARFDEAVSMHHRALEISPDDMQTHQALGETLIDKSDVLKAEPHFNRVLNAKPDSLPAIRGLAQIEITMGKFQKAAEYLRRAQEIDPGDISSAAMLGSVGMADSNKEIAHLTERLSRNDILDLERVSVGFALGKLFDDLDLFSQAFKHYDAANKLFRKIQAEQGDQFDGDSVRTAVSRRISTFDPDFFEQRKDWGDPSHVPVFIVGMPRSGTTLTEQIAASHSKVHGAGELRNIGQAVAGLKGAEDGLRWNRDELRTLAAAHLRHLAELGGASIRVVDKLPGNLMNLGLIATLYPNARVIFCRRDPRDNAISCYFQTFKGNLLLYSYDLNDCGQQIVLQQQMMEHWQRVLPLRHITMQYEDLIADPEGQSRRLIDFLGLDWEPACLNFHKTERPVLTASVWQVRQPIYTKSVGRWKHYEKHLGPLMEALKGKYPGF